MIFGNGADLVGRKPIVSGVVIELSVLETEEPSLQCANPNCAIVALPQRPDVIGGDATGNHDLLNFSGDDVAQARGTSDPKGAIARFKDALNVDAGQPGPRANRGQLAVGKFIDAAI